MQHYFTSPPFVNMASMKLALGGTPIALEEVSEEDEAIIKEKMDK